MHTRRMVVAGVALCALFVSSAGASPEDRVSARPLAEITIDASRVDWQPAGDPEHLVLTIAGPGDLFFREEFSAGQTPFLSLFQRDGKPLPDGSYTYELRAREILDSGYFKIQGGRFATGQSELWSTSDSVKSMTAAYTFSEDLIVDGQACIGDSCTAADDFYPLTLNQELLGILFDDVTGLSANHDWAIVINDALGSGEYFAVVDVETNDAPFRIEGDAPQHSLYVRSNGNIGLRTSTPGAPLHIYGSATSDVYAAMGSDPVSGPSFNFGYGGFSFGRGAGFLNARPDASATAPNPSLRFLTVNVERMIVTNTGSVGIGTSAPSSRLHVNGGDIRVSGGSFIDDGVTLNTPDYVFEPSYSLMPLAELKEFISREKHLPNIPSAAEVKSGGLDLGQFQMRLLEKIEELALYTLKQEEDLQRLGDENRALAERLEALEKAQGDFN